MKRIAISVLERYFFTSLICLSTTGGWSVAPLMAEGGVRITLQSLSSIVTPESEATTESKVIISNRKVRIAAMTKPMLVDDRLAPPIYASKLLIGDVNSQNVNVSWNLERPIFKKVWKDGAMWSVTDFGGGTGFAVTFLELKGIGWILAYAEFPRGANGGNVSGFPFCEIVVGDKGPGVFESVQIMDAGNGRVRILTGGESMWAIQSSPDRKKWEDWIHLGEGGRATCVAHGSKKTLLFVSRTGAGHEFNLVASEFTGAPLKAARAIVSLPGLAQPAACALPDGGICAAYCYEGKIYVVVGDEKGVSWSDPQRLDVALEKPKSISLGALDHQVIVAITTEEGRLHIGTLDGTSLQKAAKYPVEAVTMERFMERPPETSTLEERKNAIRELRRLGDVSSLPFLIKHTAEGYPWVIRSHALAALGALRSPETVKALVAMLRQKGRGDPKAEEEPPEARLRRQTIRALEQIGDRAALPALEAVAKSPEEYPSVRQLAEAAAGRLRAGGHK